MRVTIADRRHAGFGFVLVLAGLLAGAGPVLGTGWTAYRGPNHDGSTAERIRLDWAAQRPVPLWKTNVTWGYSSVTASGGKVFTLVSRVNGGTNAEFCVALSAATGVELWGKPIDAASYPSGSEPTTPGPRSTPVLDGDNVYIFGAHLKLRCLKASDGTTVWSKDLKTLHGGSVIGWQNAASPLIEGDLLYVNCNSASGTLLALNKRDGSQVWRRHTDAMTHATPIAATILGVRQIIFMAQSGLVSVAPATGDVLWRYGFPYSTSTGASPVVGGVNGDVVYCSAAYAKGAAAVRLTKSATKWTATELWRKEFQLMNHWSTPVHYAGYLYGLFNADYDAGQMKFRCIDIETGEEQWATTGFNRGGIARVGDHLVALAQNGQVALVKATPAAYTQVAKFAVVSGFCANVPVISDGRIYARGDKEIAALDVSLPPPPPLRLQGVTYAANGILQVRVADADGSAIDASRAAQIRLFTAGDPGAAADTWAVVPGTPVLESGALLFEDAQAGTFSQRFYQAREAF